MENKKRLLVDVPEEQFKKLREEAKRKGLCLASYARMKLLETLNQG
jgi:hypothetical protein